MFEDLVDLANEGITTLCSVLRRPGGMINDAVGNAIRNPGIPVSALAERRLKIVIHIARLYARRITRTLTPVMITIDEVGNVQTLMERNVTHKNPTIIHKVGDTKAMIELLEDPDSHLSNFTEENHVPLPYVYQPVVPPLPEQDDPRGDYVSVENEMIAQASHALPPYAVNNAALAKILKDMVSEFKDVITWARDSFCNCDGRQVMLDWMLHFCGTAR